MGKLYSDDFGLPLAKQVTKIKKDLKNLLTNSYTSVFTAVSDNTKLIPHNFSDYVSGKDELQVIYNSIIMEKDINYAETETGIDLVDWSISTDEQIKFKIFKNIK